MSAKFRLAMTGLIVLSAFTGCAEEDTPSPPPSVVTVTETASPTPSSTAHPSASTKPKRAHSQAKFDHFIVTVDDLERVNSSEVRLLAKVCVRSLPPDPQGKRTRISWDPWSVRARAKMIDADPAHATFKGAFPADDIYRVGQCASGWIPFLARGSVTKIKYSNGVGDGAVWDTDHLDRKPEIRAERSPTPQKSTPPTKGQRSPERVLYARGRHRSNQRRNSDGLQEQARQSATMGSAVKPIKSRSRLLATQRQGMIKDIGTQGEG